MMNSDDDDNVNNNNNNRHREQQQQQEQEAACRRLQRAWRQRFRWNTTSRLVARAIVGAERGEAGATLARARAISFDALVVELRTPRVVARMRACLQRIHCLCLARHGLNGGDNNNNVTTTTPPPPSTVNVRVFLSAYLIAARPTHVFEDMGALEGALFDASLELVRVFERVVLERLLPLVRARRGAHFATAVPHAESAPFVPQLHAFLRAFRAWKVPDEAKLTQRIRHALVALYLAEAQLLPPPSGDDNGDNNNSGSSCSSSIEPADSPLRVELRTQIGRLRGKLVQIAGPAALAAFDAERAQLVRAASVPPSPSTSTSTPAAAVLLRGPVTSEQLAHELLLDPSFRLADADDEAAEGHSPFATRIRAAFHRAFWDSLADDLRTACYTRVLRVLREIRDGVAETTSTGAIHAALDLEHIEAQAAAGLYSWQSCRALVAAVVAIIQRAQAPRRDAQMAARWRTVAADMAEADMEADMPAALRRALEFLLGAVNLLRIDAANARLHLIAPVIREHGVEYERGKFDERLASGALTLEHTRVHIRRALRTEAQLAPPLPLPPSPSRLVRVHTAMLLQLITSTTSTTTTTTVPAASALQEPETLHLDAHRLDALRAEFDFQALAAVHLVVAAQLLAPHPALRPLQRALGVFLTDAPGNTAVLAQGVRGIVACAQQQLQLQLPTQQQQQRLIIEAFVDTVARGQDGHVGALVRARVAAVWRFVLLHDGRYPTRAEAPELSAMHDGGAAGALRARIVAACARLLRFALVNRQVHAPHYMALIITEEEGGEASADAPMHMED